MFVDAHRATVARTSGKIDRVPWAGADRTIAAYRPEQHSVAIVTLCGELIAGRSLWYFETDGEGRPVRVLRYGPGHSEDHYVGLGQGSLRGLAIVLVVRQVGAMPQLVILTGPIAAGKNTVADKLAERLTGRGNTVVVADVDDVAAMVAPPGAAQAGLWFAAHQAHGALVGQWMRSGVEYVVAVGPIYTAEEQMALTLTVPGEAVVLWVVIDATVAVTFARAQADPGRGLSREPKFHHAAHRRFRDLLPAIPADRSFNSEQMSAEQIAAAIEAMIDVR